MIKNVIKLKGKTPFSEYEIHVSKHVSIFYASFQWNFYAFIL